MEEHVIAGEGSRAVCISSVCDVHVVSKDAQPGHPTAIVADEIKVPSNWPVRSSLVFVLQSLQ